MTQMGKLAKMVSQPQDRKPIQELFYDVQNRKSHTEQPAKEGFAAAFRRNWIESIGDQSATLKICCRGEELGFIRNGKFGGH
jgi:hypothetical protein